MILENEQQREILVAAIKAANWPGRVVKEVATVLHQVEKAEVRPKTETK